MHLRMIVQELTERQMFQNRNIYIYMNGGFSLFCGPSIEDLPSPPTSFYNLVSQVLALFHHEWSRFPILEGRPRTSFIICCMKTL